MAGTTAFNLTGAIPKTFNITGTTPLNNNMQTSTPMFGGAMGGTPQNRALNNLQTGVTAPPAPTGQQVTSHSVTHPDGTVVTQKYAPTSGVINKSTPSPAPTTPPAPTSPSLKTYTGSTMGLLNIGGGAASNGVSTAASGLQNIASGGGETYQGVDGNYYYRNQFDSSGRNLMANNQVNTQKAQGLLQGFAQNQTPAVLDAEKRFNETADNPYMIGALSNAGIAESVAAGAGQQFATNYSAQLAAKQAEVANALTGQSQQIGAANDAGSQALTGQTNQINAGQDAGNLGVQQQNAQTTALNNAATQTKPEALSYGQQFGTPADLASGAGTGNSALNPQTVATNLAADVVAGRKSYADAVAALGYAGNAGQTFLNQALKDADPNFNVATANGQYAANQSNTSTVGTAATQAANTGYQGAVQEYQDNTAKYTALTGVSNQLTGTLENYANNGVLTDANAAINTLQGHLSNPDYQRFIAAMGNAQASYQAILGSSGVTPTKADQDAVNALNPNSSATAIVAALNQLSADAHSLIIVPSYQKVQNYKQQLGIK